MSFVVPGEKLAVEEEAIPMTGVYPSGDGYLRSMIVGQMIIDKYKKIVHVRPAFKRELTLRPGSVVEGVVITVSDEIAVVKVYSAENNRVSAVGLLHISQVSGEFVPEIHECIRPSDIIRAKVLNSFPPYLLSMKEASMGVILAYCSNCGEVLKLHTSGALFCRNCGRQEKRKVAVGYIYVQR